MLLFVPPLTHSTWDHQIMGMGYDAGRNRKNEILLFTAGKRGGVLWDLGLTNVLRHRRLPRRKGEQARSASEARRAPEGRRRAEHEAEKPVELFWELARAVTQAGDVVADFFVDEADGSRGSSRKEGMWWRWTGSRGGSGRSRGILSRSGSDLTRDHHRDEDPLHYDEPRHENDGSRSPMRVAITEFWRIVSATPRPSFLFSRCSGGPHHDRGPDSYINHQT